MQKTGDRTILFKVTSRIPQEAFDAAARKGTPILFPVSHEDDQKKVVTGTFLVRIVDITTGEREDVVNFQGDIIALSGVHLALRFRDITLAGMHCAGHASTKETDGQIKINIAGVTH